MLNLDSICEFTWNFGNKFLLKELKTGNYFVWSDPDYSGDNTIEPFSGNPRNFTHEGFCGRDKGVHTIRNYCGENVIFSIGN